MIRSQQWCIQQIPGGGYRLCRIFRPKKGAVIFGEVLETNSIKKCCRGNLFFSFIPEEYHLFTDKFPELKPELLDLQIKKRFTDTGLAMDPANLIHTTRKIPERAGYYNSIFLPAADLHRHLDQLARATGITRCRLVPEAAAISSLIKTITNEAVLVFFTGTHASQILMVKNGILLYNQSLALTGSGEVEQTLIPNAIDFARVNVRNEHNIDQFRILVLGPGRDSIQLDSLGLEQWQPDFSGTIQTTQPDDVYRYPQLFGAFFAVPDYSFLPEYFARIWTLQNISKNITFCAVAGALLMFGGWRYLQPGIALQETEYVSTLADLERQQQRITNKIPPQEDLGNIERLFTIKTHAARDFRLDQLAAMLAGALPSRVFITSLTMKRQAGGAEGTTMAAGMATPPNYPPGEAAPGALSLPETLQSQPFTISLHCSSDGTYTDVTTRFKKAAKALSSLFIVADYAWDYQEQENTGTMHCELSPKTNTADTGTEQ